MKGKVKIEMDAHELDLLIQASIAASKSSFDDNYKKSNDLVNLADKLATAKDELKWNTRFGNEEKPTVAGQTFQGHIVPRSSI